MCVFNVHTVQCLNANLTIIDLLFIQTNKFSDVFFYLILNVETMIEVESQFFDGKK